MSHRPSAFTLIELLVVILLLTVLMLTAFPAFRGLERTTNRHRAVAEADALAQAALAYRRTYGQWPLEDQASGVDANATALIAGHGLPQQHLELAQVVAALRNTRTELNSRGILFLELPDDRLDTDGTPLDPWRQPYVLVMARSGEGNTIAHTEGGINTLVARSSSATNIVVDGSEDAAAFSWGDPDSRPPTPLFSWSKR